jgi:hypothetical protein
MRPLAVVLASVLVAAPLAAQAQTTPQPPLDLPVSVERIREALSSPGPFLLDALDRQPNFRIEVEERRPTFAEIFGGADFKGGPVPPGGLYAYEQQRRMFPNSTPPLFSLDAMPIVGGLVNAIGDWRRARSAAAARAEVERAMAEFCAAQPDGGADVVGCEKNR